MGTTDGQQSNNQDAARQSGDRRSHGGESSFDVNRVVRAMIGRASGNAKAVIRHLVKEGRRYRNRIAVLEADLAKRPQELKDGEVVLAKDDATRWNAIKDLKLTPDQIKEGEAAKVREAQGKQADLIRKGGKDAGIKRLALLAEQVIAKGMVAEDREVVVTNAEGKRVKEMQVHVRPASNDKAPWVPLKDYVEKDMKDLAPALMADEEPEGEDDASDDRGREREESTVLFPAQRGARGRAPAKNDPVVKVVGQKYASPSELRSKSNQGA